MTTDIQPNTQSLPPEKIDLIKRTICRDATDDELELFLYRCRTTGLDPFLQQIHAVKRWDGQQKKHVMSIQTGIAGFRLIAERTGNYAPGRQASFEHDAEGRLLAATAYVLKCTKDGTWHEVAETARYEEFVQLTKESKPNKFWREKPHLMLAKCAEAAALRRAFPADLSGIGCSEDNGAAEAQPQAEPRRQVESRQAETIGKDVILKAFGARNITTEHAIEALKAYGQSKNRSSFNELTSQERRELLAAIQAGEFDENGQTEPDDDEFFGVDNEPAEAETASA